VRVREEIKLRSLDWMNPKVKGKGFGIVGEFLN